MKTFILILIALAVTSTNVDAANINKGNWQLGASFALSHAPETSSYSFYSESEAQYFIADHISAGLTGYFADSSHGFSSGGIGPIGSFYFLTDEKTAPYISLAPVQWAKAEGLASDFRSTAKVGVRFFLTDSVAFGPALQYDLFWGTGYRKGFDTVSFLGGFSVHL